MDSETSALEPLPPGSLVFVDIDNTLIKGASVYLFGIEAWRQGFMTWRDVAPALRDQRHFVRQGESAPRMASARERALGLVAGHRLEDFQQVARSAWENRMRPRVFPEMLERIAWHHGQNHQIFLATASPVGVAEVMADGLGLDGVVGTELETVDGVFTGSLGGPLVHGPVKAEAVKAVVEKEGINPRHTAAYSDSIADAPLLQQVGQPTAVNPDQRLHQLAMESGWPVLWPKTTRRYRRVRQ